MPYWISLSILPNTEWVYQYTGTGPNPANMDPKKLDKYLYIRKSPVWLISGIHALGLLAWCLVLYGYKNAVIYDPFYRYAIAPILIIFSAYYFLSYGINVFFYRQHDLKKHKLCVDDFLKTNNEPSVDVFLPICGESMALLEHTWKNVSELNYTNKKVYVLDDSRTELEEHQNMAKKYGFNYISRPDKGWMKKAGNLRYAFERTDGMFIAIFDADFAPHPEFLNELLPYMDNKREKVGIVQSPQYFEMTKKVHKRSPLEYGAGYVQEAFYRYIQVARNYFRGSICCGSNAIYRREALNAIGGPVLIEHSEDAITGFTLTDAGWSVLYVPIILAVGVCPDDAHAYFHQQHRWCTGSMTLLLKKQFWQSKISWTTKGCYFIGFLFYICNPFSILFSFQLFYSLFVYNQYISLANGMLFYPYLIWTLGLMLLLPIYRFRWGSFRATFLQLYAYSHAVFSIFLRSTVGWIPTNTKYAGVSTAFKQATTAVYIYTLTYVALAALAFRKGMIHLLNYNYYSVQFWIFYNIFFSLLLLWYMYTVMKEAHQRQVANATSSAKSFVKWQLAIGGGYALLLISVFLGIIFL